MDDGIPWVDSPAGRADYRRRYRLHVCRIYQRELLGLIKTLLVREAFPPMTSSQFVTQQALVSRETIQRIVASAKTQPDIPRRLTGSIGWDPINLRAFALTDNNSGVEIPYTDAIRNEIRSIAGNFLTTVPVHLRKAGDAMEP